MELTPLLGWAFFFSIIFDLKLSSPYIRKFNLYYGKIGSIVEAY